MLFRGQISNFALFYRFSFLAVRGGGKSAGFSRLANCSNTPHVISLGNSRFFGNWKFGVPFSWELWGFLRVVFTGPFFGSAKLMAVLVSFRGVVHP